MLTNWCNRVPSYHFFNQRRDVGQRHVVAKVGKLALPHNIVHLRLCSALRVRVKNHREEKCCDGLSEKLHVSQVYIPETMCELIVSAPRDGNTSYIFTGVKKWPEWYSQST